MKLSGALLLLSMPMMALPMLAQNADKKTPNSGSEAKVNSEMQKLSVRLVEPGR
jgi:hypothetical protein